MIKLYDIISDEEFHPTLVELSSWDINPAILKKHNGMEVLFKKLELNHFDNERVFLISLDMYDRILGIYLIGLGDYKGSQIFNRHITTVLLLSGARKFFVVHNHPDGALFLSEDDNTMVIVMMTLAKILEIIFLESYVITRDGYISNLMNKPVMFERR